MLWLLILILGADLSTIKTEPNPERRSELALDNAKSVLTSGREAYAAGDYAKATAKFDEVQESVTLAYDSLEQSGKDARRSPKFFKQAELATRELIRRLDGLMQSVSVEDRPALEKVRERVSDVHENLLKLLLEKKK